MNNKPSILFISLLLVLTGCKEEKNLVESDIEGVWAFTSPDNRYGELIISEKKFYSENKGEGNLIMASDQFFNYYYSNMTLADFLFNYRLENDTFKIYNIDILIPSLKLAKVNRNELNGNILTDTPDSTFTIKLTRLKEDNEIIKSLLVDTLSWENIHFQKYIDGYRARKEKMQ